MGGCEPTYEELKLFCSRNTNWWNRLRAYLWGIETSEWMSLVRWAKRLRAYLWGIETGISTRNSFFSCMLRAYLWGIETELLLIGNYLYIFLLRAYLWGIETIEIHCINYLRVCFEPTYEELKLSSSSSLLSLSLRCEPTYEELKQYSNSLFTTSFIWLRAYLWGIETSMLSALKRPYFRVASLPMRNWNWSGYLLTAVFQSSCEPTYEELKPWIFPSTYTFPIMLRAYLWGIETNFSYPCIHNIKSVASLPMRNWNPVFICIHLWPLLVASLPMRNWNL